ncbi:MAG: UDP-N-acetylmuramate--L-alanine ligase [Candidatus Neptunochlamydia sp.]|nr:UDP-N-acetylmuramate--L-alanine ligase [Candidatus Neptunochlamydia sp.]
MSKREKRTKSDYRDRFMTKGFHFLGIKGIGMSALAHILLEKGIPVSGSDLSDISSLEALGVKRSKTLPDKGTIIYSSAIPSDHPALLQGRKEKRSILHRSELINSLLKGKKGLLVAGTHGKTSTSSLLSWVLISAGLHPSFAVGGILQNLQKNGGYGTGDFFVLEADESDGSFLNYEGEGAIVTNIEKEHLAFWKNEKKLVEGFQTFISRIRDKKLLFWCKDDPLLKKIHPPGTSYGKEGDLSLLLCEQNGEKTVFSAQFEGKVYQDIELPLMGERLALNALAIFGLSLKLGISEEVIRKAFLSFKGVKRRHEKIGEIDSITIYDDYAHHPTEIKALLKSLKKMRKRGRLIALFQPHRFSRTQELFSDFNGAFDSADLLILTSIYPAGEKPIPGITGKTLFKQVDEGNALFLEKEFLLDYLPKMLLPGDILVTIGAGDIAQVGIKLLQELS